METVNDQVLATRIQQLSEYKDYLRLVCEFAVILPEEEREELAGKVQNALDLLAREAEQLRLWNLERASKH